MALRRISPILGTPWEALAAVRAAMDELRRQQASAAESSKPTQVVTTANNGPTTTDGGIQNFGRPALYLGPENSTVPQFYFTPTNYEDPVQPDQTGTEARDATDAILEDIEEGKSIDLIAEEQGKSREEVIAELKAAGYTVETTEPESDNGDVRTTEVTDPQSGRGVTEYYDFHDGTYHTGVKEDGEEVRGPVRDERGWKVEEQYDSDTGVTTTRYEDDLGDGTIVEETRLPSGVVIRKTTPEDGDTTTVVISDGEETELNPEQVPTKEGSVGILEDVIAGKSIATIAEERGLTREQVIAQLEAAGYDVSATDPSNSNYYNQSVLITLAGSDEVVASYSRNEHNTTTVEYVEDDGDEVHRISYVDGRVVETVVDKEGRRTVTTTEPGENGDPQETVEVTFNGYTLTTDPDGKMVLKNNEDGAEIEIERGSLEETLARKLLAINPDGDDPAQAAQDEIVMTVIEGMFAGKTYEDLIEEAGERREATEAAIEEHGLGPEAQPTVETDEEGNVTGINFQGEPPAGLDPNVDWVPMKVDGTWRWVHPEVARAIAAENVTLGEMMQLQAEIEQIQAQLDVWALDPDAEEATEAAGTTLDETLGEHGYRWVRPEPEGDLSDARERLSNANDRVTDTEDALEAYEESERLLDEAITKQANMPFYPDGETPVITSADSDYNYQEEYKKGVAAHAEVDALLSQANYQRTLGDSLVTGITLADLESQFGDGVEGLPDDVEPVEITVGDQQVQVAPEVAEAYEEEGLPALAEGGQPVGIQRDTDGDSTLECLWIDAETATTWLQLKAEQDAIGRQVEIDQAYVNLYQSRSDLADAEVELEDIKQRLLAEYNRNNPQLFEDDDFQGNEIVAEDGHLWVVNHYENGETKYQLTWDSDDVDESYSYHAFGQEWQTFQGTKPDSDVCSAGTRLDILQRAEQSAGETVNRTLEEQLGVRIDHLGEQIEGLEAEYGELLEEHGPGSVEPPEGSFPEGVEPLKIEIGGRDVYMHPDVADAYEANGLEALTTSDTPVRVEIDSDGDGEANETRWVDPQLAYTWLALELARDMRGTLEDTRDMAESAADWLAFQRTQSLAPLDEEGRREHLQGLESAYFEERQGDVLENIQQQIGAHYERGYDETFRSVTDQTVIEALHLDTSTEEGSEALDKVMNEIRDIGGDDAEVRVVPLFYVDPEKGVQQMALFAVRNEQGDVRCVDIAGKAYDDVGDFQDNNSLFSEDGHLIVPTDFQMTPGSDSEIALEVVKARNVSAWDKVVDPLVGIGTAIATVASFTPAAPIAAPLAVAGGTYLGTRAAIRQYNHLQHGGEWGETESLMNMAMIATTALPMISGGLRSIGMVHSLNLTKGQAFLAGMGAVRTSGTANAAAHSTRFSRLWHQIPHARQVGTYMRSAGGLNLAAYTLDGGAMVIGAPLMYFSVKDLVLHHDQMSGLQIADAITGFMTGLAGTGMGAASFVSYARANGPPTFRLTDQNGQNIIAFAYGEPPASGDRVYVPQADGPQRRGDDPSLADKTHILVRDPETGEAAVIPWIRGASNEHTPPPGNQPRPAEEGDPATESTAQANSPESSEAHPGNPPPASPLSGREVRELTRAAIPTLTDSYLKAIEPRHMSQLSADQVGALTPRQIGKLTFDQLAAFRPKQLRALSAEQLQAIPPSRLEAIKPGRIAQLKPEQVASFTPKQIAALTPDHTAKITVNQWKALGEAQLQTLSSEQLATLTPRKLSELRPEQVASFTSEQITALTPDQMTKLTTDQWKALGEAQLQTLSSEQLATLTPEKLSELRPEQVAAFLPAQLEALTPAQVGALKAEHFNALSKEQLRIFAAEQLQAISPETISGIARGIMRKFAPEQISAFTLRQLNAFTSEQAGALRWSQKLKLSPEQSSALGIMEPAIIIGYSTVVVGSAAFGVLPPYILAPISASAFGFRGLGMFVKAKYPDKTGPDQPLGRILRGVDALTFMPNIASGYLNLSESPFVNSTYQIGNLMYAGKSIEELRTRKSAFPQTDKVALPIYAAGTLEYMRGPTGELIGDVSTFAKVTPDIVAGGLFAYGSGHLLYDAWRPSLTKDGKPGLGPRVVLAVTFGGGLLAFSAMSWADIFGGDQSAPPPDDDTTPEDSVTTPVPEESRSEPEREEPPTEPEEPETPGPQLVVIAEVGLNLREEAASGSEAITVLRPGSFIHETGERRTDDDGNEWVAVTGFSWDGQQYEGWVDASFVAPHEEGAQDADGRFNPQLESEGYQWISVQPGQSIGSIARSRSVDVADTIVLNMDHIHNPHLIFVGDRIYMPQSATV
ncbi:DUF4781 domain-containing protein [Chelativorans salis]|uniref:DUF4781 domain-containing protein n=1 Tax=Chelativorans salis TaxID=2978478 RepID=A0ABT2LQI7_9HYPH|nr:DUF4781 domain-containing protein [Chelativorans sp. EGI FJ00035]MCT7376815.1 DUF4781 domain-containing protein [Chelativorans sp. EGI FJ00035]